MTLLKCNKLHKQSNENSGMISYVSPFTQWLPHFHSVYVFFPACDSITTSVFHLVGVILTVAEEKKKTVQK